MNSFYRFSPLLIFFIIIILLPIHLLGQTLYLKVDYFKASSENIADYLYVEQELWRPIHQERLNRGIILGWSFYSVFVGEPDVPYNYIAVNVFDDFELVDYYGLNEIVAEVYPDKDLSDFYQQTRESREVVRTEIWRVDGFAGASVENLPVGNYITKNFFDERGGTGEHMEMELDFWGGIHNVRVDREILNSWAMYTLYYPAGDARHYTYSTVDYYENLGDLTIGAGIDLARAAYPDRSDEELNELFARTGASRTLFKTEIWKLLDSVGYQ
ncbi:MAG: hypothetical protein EA359_08380 [Balneolaceae bacterium]|nr:MAG: hypothetical protein EA359_08380 [Balneolaceae bacterium]